MNASANNFFSIKWITMWYTVCLFVCLFDWRGNPSKHWLFLLFFYTEYMLQVNPANRPDIKEVLTGLEAIAIAMDVELKGKVVSCLGVGSLIIFIILYQLKKAPWMSKPAICIWNLPDGNIEIKHLLSRFYLKFQLNFTVDFYDRMMMSHNLHQEKDPLRVGITTYLLRVAVSHFVVLVFSPLRELFYC